MSVATNIYLKLARVPYDKQMEYIFYQRRQDTPMLDMLSKGAEKIGTKEVRWVRNEIMPRMYVINDLSTSTGVTTLQLTTGSAANASGEPVFDVYVNKLIRLDSEIVRVTGLNPSTAVTPRSGTTNGYVTVTVARGQLGTTAATHAASFEEAFPVGNMAPVTDTYNGAVNDPGQEYVEYVTYSKIDDYIDNFDMVIASDPGGTGIQRSNYRKAMVFAADMEAQVLWSQNTAPTESTPYGSFTGLIAGCAPTGATYTASGITRNQFEDVLDDAEAGGIDVDTVVCGSLLKKALNSWYQGMVTKTSDDGKNIQRIDTWLPSITASRKPVRIIYHKQLPAGYVLVLDSSYLSLKYLERPTWVTMGSRGNGLERQLEAKWLLLFKGRGKGKKITDLTGYA